MVDRLLAHLEDNASPITCLVGENGSGKSRRLAELASELIESGRRVIAIANTVFDRFPRVRRSSYMRLSPSIGRRYAAEVFKRALTSSPAETLRNASLIGKALEYTGFEPVIGLHVRLRAKANLDDLGRVLEGEMPSDDIPVVLRALEIYRNYKNYRQSAWVDMYGGHIGPDRRELLGLLKHEFKLKRIGLVENVSITLGRRNSFYELDDASSGEVSLLATYAYIATHIEEGDIVLIDEPENSLHPRWQREYCRRLLDQFYLYSPRFLIATHSPNIVQGAQSSDVDVSLVRMPSDQVTSEPITKSIEGTLFEVFGVLSPANHYLSEKVTHLLNELVQHRQDLETTREELKRLRELSEDDEQRDFLSRAIELAAEVHAKLKSRENRQ